MAEGIEVGRGYIAVDVDQEGAAGQLRGLASVGTQALGAVALAAGTVAGAVATAGISFNSLTEQATIAFSTLLKDGDRAKTFLAELTDFAASTPFELPGLIDNARQLLGVGVAADKVIPTLQALGDTAGALGLDQEAFNRILLATSQALSKGKLQGEELLQLAENGIPVYQLLSKALGLSVPEIQKLASEGKLLAADVLPKLYDQMSKDYGGAMAAQSKTLAGTWSTLKDTGRILAGVGLKPVFDEGKKVLTILGSLAGSDEANQFAERFAAKLDVAIGTTKQFGIGVRREFGPQTSQAFSQFSDRAERLARSVGDVLDPALDGLVTVADKAVPALLAAGQAAGGVLQAGLEAAGEVASSFRDNADGIGKAVETAGEVIHQVGSVAVPVLGTAFGLVAAAGGAVLEVIDRLSGPLGVLTGGVVAGAAAWRTYQAAAGLAGTVFSAVRPDQVGERLKGVNSRLDDVSLSAGVLTERFTGSAKAGEKVATAGAKVGTVLSRVGSVLPLVGVGAVAFGTALELIARDSERAQQNVNRLADALVRGGQDGRQAQTELEGMRRRLAEINTEIERQQNLNLGDFGDLNRVDPGLVQEQQKLVKTLGDVTAAEKQRRASITELTSAQDALTAAHRSYDDAVRTFGAASPQAVTAQQQLALAAAAVEREQRKAADATKSHTDRITEQAQQAFALANADLGLRQAQAGVEQAQRNAREALEQYGATSAEVTQATLALEQSYLAAADAAARKAIQETQGRPQTAQAAAATQAYVGELLRLAAAAGKDTPPAISKLIAGLDESQLAAFRAAAQTGLFRTEVINLPDGRTVTIAVNDLGTPIVNRLYADLSSIEKTWTATVRILQDGRVPTGAFNIGPRAAGGPVKAGTPYMVGEQGIPELYVPDYDGYIHSGEATRRLLANVAGAGQPQGGGGIAFHGPVYAHDPYELAERLETRRRDAMVTTGIGVT